MSSSPSVVDVVVVGGGVMGAAATWRLARRGRTVVLLERFGAGHTRGASHGASRIYRQTYAAAPYVRLTVEALPLWRELEAETGAALLTITGGVDHGDPRRTAELAGSLAAHGIAHHWLDADEAGGRWPGMRFDGPVLVQPDRSGRIHADQAVAALTAAARGRGARVRRNTRVTAIRVRGDDLVEAETQSGVVLARRAVVTAGAWTAELLDGLVPLPPLRVTQEQPAYFPLVGVNPCAPQEVAWPTFIHHTADGDDSVYGLADPCGDIKVGLHGTGSECHPDRRTFRPEPAQLQRLQDYVAQWLPGLDHTRPDPISCTYTSTPDSGFVLERRGPLVVGAGFSGHGFKFAPAIGRVLADLATGASDLAGVR
ncbi:MAG: sarcosine oxidase [Pseudonocardiales bacterium]|jgi:sarcosine oxidase|nr:sarcosine oxidase [Pseudonocardiales bacterium]